MDKNQIPDYIRSLFGNTVEDIFKNKTSDKQTRPQLPQKAPELIAMTAKECAELCESSGLEFKDGMQDRVIRYVFSDETVDRMGDIIRASGWDLKNFRKNPVILGFHNSYNYPVGNAIRAKVEGKQLAGDVVFIPRDISEQADQAFRIAKAKFMRAGSVGFLPKEWNNPTDPKEREKLGLGKWGVEFKKQELLEYSLVSVPANPAALQNSIKEGNIRLEDFKGWWAEDDFEKVKTQLQNRSIFVMPEKQEPPEEKGLVSVETVQKMIEDALENQKSGAVLSKKNKAALQNAVDAMQKAATSIQSVLDSSGTEEPPEKNTEGDDLDLEDFNFDDNDELDIDESYVEEILATQEVGDEN